VNLGAVGQSVRQVVASVLDKRRPLGVYQLARFDLDQ
jgi:hypothetical protein